MASITDKLKSSYARLANRTDLDERASKFFRPKTGTLATAGRQAYQNFARQPIPQPLRPVNRELGRFLTTKSPVASTMRGIGRGTLQWGTFGFTRVPQYTQPNTAEKAGEAVGGLVGSMASFGTIAKPLEGIGKAGLAATRLRNVGLAQKAIPALTREIGQSAAWVGGSKLGGEKVDFKKDLAFGLGMSALGGSGALRGFGKGMDQGRTPKIEWDPEDSAILDRLRGAIKNRKITDQELDAVDTWMTRLANGYMKNSEIERIANKWGGNRRKMLEEMGEVMFKRSKDAPQLRESSYVDDFMMGIVSGKELQNKTKKAVDYLHQAQSPEDAIKRIKTLEKMADTQDKFQITKKALKEYRKTLVTGPGLPQHPDNAPVIEAIDILNLKNIKDFPKQAPKPQSTVGGVSQTGNKIPQTLKETVPQIQPPASMNKVVSTPQTPKLNQQTPVLNPSQTPRIVKPVPTPNNQSTAPVGSLDNIIAEGRKSIGATKEKPGQTVKQSLDTIYTQWVDRFHPLSKASKKVKVYLKEQGKELSPKVDPDYLVRRLTGAGAIADQRFKTKLNPVLKELEASGISKPDMDTYLAHNRMLGFDQAGREIYGVDPVKSGQVVKALEQKYPGIKDLSQKFYQYQDEGLQELANAGFFTKADIQAMRSQNPNYAPLYRVMDDVSEYLGLPTRKTMQGTSPVKRVKGSKRQIESPVESIIGNTFSQRAAIEKNRVAQSIVNLQNITDMGFKKVSKAGNDTITVWKDGKKEYWNVGQDIADVARGANEEAMNFALKLAQAPAQLLRQGATGRNPAFMIPNVVRDQLDAGITSKYGYIPFIDYVKGLIEVGKKDLNTTFGTSFNTKIYDDWAKSGAKIDLGELSGKKDITKLFNEKKAKRGLFNWLTSGLDLMGRYSEQPTRVGLYKKAFEKTSDPLKAMMESRDATVDFARMGSKMKVANSIIPFLNVGVQGFDKLARAFKNNPGKVLLNMGIYAATPATVITAYNLKNYPEEYSEIPQYDKDSNFVIVKGRNADGTVDYLTIPKGNVVPIIANPIQAFMEHLAGVDGKSFSELAISVLSETLPVLESGNTPMEVVAKTAGSMTPQFMKPIIEDVTNRNFYKYDSKKEAQGRDSGVIVPSYLKSKPAYQQTYEFTPQMYQKMGAALNVSPLRLKNLMEGYMAGYAKIPAQVVEMLYASSRGEKISPNDKTVLSRFVKQTYPSSSKAKEKEKIKVPGFMDRMTGKVSAAEEVGMELPTTTKDLSTLYKDAQNTINKYQENKVKSQYGLVDKTLDEYQAEVDAAIKLSKRIEKERPEQVFEIGLETYNKNGGADTKDRTKWAIEQLQKSKDPKSMIQKLYEGQVLTQSVVEELNEKYGLGLTKYNYGDGFRNLPGSGGKKGKKAKKTISDAQILSAYKKALQAAYKRPQRTEVRSIRSATKPIKLKRSKVKMLY